MNKAFFWIILFSLFSFGPVLSQEKGIVAVSASVNANQSVLTLDGNLSTGWAFSSDHVRDNHFLMFTLQTPSDVKGLVIDSKGITNREFRDLVDIYVTYDPMNLGDAIDYTVKGNNRFTINFPPKYGAHVRISFKRGFVNKSISINEIDVIFEEKNNVVEETVDQPWRDSQLPVEKRVELLLAAMTPADKMELLRFFK
jgi:beta-glucosidase